MNWQRIAVVLAAIAGGFYAMKLGDVKTGAALLGLAGLLTDPTAVIAAVKAWKGGGA